jgi:hypothetical protein
VAASGPSEHLLYTFSRMFLQDPAGVGPLDEDETEVYAWLYQQAEQYRRERGPMAVKDSAKFTQSMMEMFDSLSAAHPELVDKILARRPPEQVLSHYAPEQRLAGLSPEERLRGLSPEELEQLKRLLH